MALLFNSCYNGSGKAFLRCAQPFFPLPFGEKSSILLFHVMKGDETIGSYVSGKTTGANHSDVGSRRTY